MDNALKKHVGKGSHPKWSVPMSVAMTFIRKYLSAANGDIKTIRRAIDLPAPLTTGVTCQKKFVLRREEVFMGPDSVDFIKADWIYPSNASSFSSSCTSSNHNESRCATQGPIVLYLHGGGYFACSRKTHRIMTGKIAKSLSACVLVPDYRRAPEAPFPLPLHDAISCYLELIEPKDPLSPKYDPKQIFVMGDSAGGGMALSLLLWLKDRPQYSMPAGIVAISPFLDLTLRQPSFILNRPFDFLTGLVGDENTHRDPKWLHSDRTHYFCESDALLTHPMVSPLFASFDHPCLPPILLQVGDCELFRDECISFYSQTMKHHTKMTLEVYESMVHVFHIFSAIEPLSNVAYRRIAEFVQLHFQSPDTPLERSCVFMKKPTTSAYSNAKVDMVSIENPYEWVEQGREKLDRMIKECGLNLDSILPKLYKDVDSRSCHTSVERSDSGCLI